MKFRLALIASIVSFLLVGCGDSNNDFVITPGNDGNVVLTSIQATPSPLTLVVGNTAQLTVTGTTNAGTTQNLTASSTFVSDTPAVATVSDTGLVTGVTVGTANITVTSSGFTSVVAVTITNPVNPATATVVVNHIFVSARAIPTNVTTVRLTGRSSGGAVLYGPESQTVDFVNTFTEVPIDVTSVTLDYLDASGNLIGTYVQAVTLTEDGTVTINDPDFEDADGLAAQLDFMKGPQGTTAAGVPMASSIVRVEDASGATVTSADQDITVELTEANGVALSGTTSVTPVNGVATFNNLILTGEGTAKLVFRYPGVRPLVSQAISTVELVAGEALPDSYVSCWGMLANAINENDFAGYPGYFQAWDLYDDLSIDDGFNDAFDEAGKLEVGGQDYAPGYAMLSELEFLTALTTVADGLPLPVVTNDNDFNPIDGDFSALLAPVAASRFFQQVDLADATGTVTLSWTDNINGIETDYDEDYEYSVTVLSSTNTVIASFTSSTSSGNANRSLDITAAAGTVVTVQFEAVNYVNGETGEGDDYFPAMVDNVSIEDGSMAEFVENGDFETGDFTGWTAQTDPESRHVRSGSPETVAGLDVIRTVYSVPTENWIRYHDTFTNNTNSPITTQVRYNNDLGSDDDGVEALVENDQGILAFTSVDSDESDNDVGFVFGRGFTTDFDGEDVDVVSEDFTVAPGETVGSVFFIVQTDDFTFYGTPLRVVAAIEGILNGFPSNPTYSQGLSADEIGALVNY